MSSGHNQCHLPTPLSSQDSPHSGLAPLLVTCRVLVQNLLLEEPGFHSPSPSQTMVTTKSIYHQNQPSTNWTTWMYTSYSYQVKQSCFLLTIRTNAPVRMPTSWQIEFKVTGQKTTLKFNKTLAMTPVGSISAGNKISRATELNTDYSPNES